MTALWLNWFWLLYKSMCAIDKQRDWKKTTWKEEGENKKGKDVSVSEEAARGLLKGSLGSDH